MNNLGEPLRKLGRASPAAQRACFLRMIIAEALERASLDRLHHARLDRHACERRQAAGERDGAREGLTFLGELFGVAPSNRPVDVRQMQIEWIKDGRISQHWRVTDELTLLRQIGVVP